MIEATYRIKCDCCNKKEWNNGDESEYDALCNAGHFGWTTRTMPNDSEWDLCPECSKIKTEDMP